jgi:hypothetical protein
VSPFYLWSGIVILAINVLYFAWVAMNWHEADKELRSEVQPKAEPSSDSQGSQEGRKGKSPKA